MKQLFSISLLVFFLFSCKKEKPSDDLFKQHYQSKGNLLVLKVSDSFEGAYEFNLEDIQLQNGSLPFESFTFFNGTQEYRAWALLPNADTLFTLSESNLLEFKTPFIERAQLGFHPLPTSVNFSSFQFIETIPLPNLQGIWSKIAHLEIVKKYRSASPGSPIGIMRVISNQLEPELGFNVPVESYYVILVKP
jgi:hypothetical protein